MDTKGVRKKDEVFWAQHEHGSHESHVAGEIYPLVMTNIAMENGPFIEDLSQLETSILKGFCMAMLNNQYIKCQGYPKDIPNENIDVSSGRDVSLSNAVDPDTSEELQEAEFPELVVIGPPKMVILMGFNGILWWF